MSFVGNNPKFKSVTFEGFADFATADATTKREGRLVWVQDIDTFYQDNGTTLTAIVAGAPGGFDVQDTIANLTSLGRVIGKLYYATDEQIPYYDNGTALQPFIVENVNVVGQVVTDKSIEAPVRLDVKQDTDANLITYAGTASNGQLCFATDTKIMYQVVDSALVAIPTSSGTIDYWQKTLAADLYTSGTMGDLAVTGLTIGEKYRVVINVRAIRQATAVSEIQEINFSVTPTFGLFQITYSGQTTAVIPYDSSAADVEDALEALSNVGVGDILVSGDFNTGFTLTFGAALGGQDVPEVTIFSNTLSSGESGGVDEIQKLSYNADPNSGSMTLNFDGQITGSISHTNSNAQIKAALEALPNVNGVSVTGNWSSGHTITFNGSLVERTNVPQISINSENLTLTGTTLGQPAFWAFSGAGAGFALHDPGVGSGSIPATTHAAAITSFSGTSLATMTCNSIPGVFVEVTPSGRFQASNANAGKQVYFKIPNTWAGQNITIKFEQSVGAPAGTHSCYRVNSGGSYTAQWTGDQGDRTTVVQNGNWGNVIVCDLLLNGGDYDFNSPDYIQVTVPTSTNVNVTPSTLTPGVAPTGGAATTATPATVLQGVSAVAGAAKLFGARVVHNGGTLAEAKYFPPADNSQNAAASVQQEKFFTASDTTISVEGEGLAAPDGLQAGNTSIIVETNTGATEN